jgi:hypothetical protein
VVPQSVTPVLAASAALLGFWFTKLAVGIALIAAEHLLLGELSECLLALEVVGAGAIGLTATRTAAVQLAASYRGRR